MLNIRRSGFTLIELLVALTVVLVIISSIVVVFRGASSAWIRGERTAFKYRQARTIVDRMSAEISQAVVSPARGAYIIGNGQGMDRIKPTGTADELFLIASIAGGGGSELCEIGYWLEDKTLYHHFQLDPDMDYETVGSDDEWADHIVDLSFRYFDGTGWVDFWAGGKGGLHEGLQPRTIEILVTIEDRRGKTTQTFKSQVTLTTSG